MPPLMASVITIKDKLMLKVITSLSLFFLIAACAGPNPNVGERTTDIGWSSGNYKGAFIKAMPHAENGEPWAQLRVAIFYENGWGTSIDNKKAVEWYRKASVQRADGDWANGQMVGAFGKTGYFNQNGDATIAEFNLARMYFEGKGVDKDLDKALMHISKVIKDSKGKSVFFCCEFSQPRYFEYSQFLSLKKDIEAELSKG